MMEIASNKSASEVEYDPFLRPEILSIHALLEYRAAQAPDAAAISAPGRRLLTNARLFHQVESTVGKLRAMGIGKRDRVGIVLANGPEMATCFLAVAACAISAPLNPAYRAEEFDFFLQDLNAKALILEAGGNSPAAVVAGRLGIPIIELSHDSRSEAGTFILSGDEKPQTEGGPAQPEDVALVLHTSGTTSRPKMVPLTQSNVLRSARNICAGLKLTPPDRCLNVMPLFHIHGLVGALLSSLAAGAEVVCTQGFYATRFFEWLAEAQPTWYTAVPTMHQAILMRAPSNAETISRFPLRFIRSCSSPLPPQVMTDLEAVFRAPVIEAYGMTEASHQVASNPLPPRPRKAGSVGVGTGPQVAIMDDAGALLSPGSTGQIVIRGDTVLAAYENNPTANEGAFSAGWFKTGDQGYVDDEGYVFITGRLKELINRGGEKIAPFEIDKALLDHPAVGQAVAFGMPDARLGEAVAAAIVLREGSSASEREILEFVALRLVGFKVPSKLIILDEIPKGGTGKVQRVGLAEKLGLRVDYGSDEEQVFTAPRTFVEETVAGMWSELLGVEKVGVHDDFLKMGGDSVIATQLVARLYETFEVEIPIFGVFRTPTVAGLSEQIEEFFSPRSSDAGGRQGLI